MGHLLALKVTPTNQDDRTQVEALSQELQAATGQSVKIAFVDQGYGGDNAAEQAEKHGINLCVVKLEEAKRGFALLPRRWVVERNFAWRHVFVVWLKATNDYPEPWLALLGFCLSHAQTMLCLHTQCITRSNKWATRYFPHIGDRHEFNGTNFSLGESAAQLATRNYLGRGRLVKATGRSKLAAWTNF
jgi:transposase